MILATCPDWICGHNNVPHDYVYLLMAIFFAIPYLLFVRHIYRIKNLKSGTKNGCLFSLAVPIGYVLYSMIMMALFTTVQIEIFQFIGIVHLGSILWLFVTIPICILGIIIVSFMKFEDPHVIDDDFE